MRSSLAPGLAFAHRQLVVHRDLKPSNILVTPRGELKLLDFGIAKLLEAEDDATVTRTEARALTPAYAAPEQIRGDPPTTATDVYGLGVVLYELLTGRLPHPKRRRPGVDLAHEIATEGVERPSRAVLREPESTTAGPAAERLARTLRDDLDTIALKALASEPERRYPTAAALADDLRRFLEGRPIAARPDTVAYRLRKFARRHRAAVAAAALAVVSLGGGLAVALWQADRARAAQASAETEARRAGRVKEFLVSLFQASNPELVRSLDVSAREVLAEGVQRLEVELDREPGVQAEILDAVARGELSLGQTETAKRHALRALALLDSDEAVGSAAATVRSRLEATLAAVEAANGDLPAAERRLRSALADLEASGRATAVDRAAIRLELGRTLAAAFKHPEAIAAFREAYELSTSAGEIGALSALAALGELANRLTFLDRREEAETAFRDALASSEQLLRDRPLLRARLERAFALFLFQEDELEAALQHARSAVETHVAILGERHVETAASQRVLAIGLLAKGETEAAVALLENAAATFAELSPLHPLHEQVVETLAAVEFHAGRADQAIARLTALAVEVERRAGSEAIQTLRAKMTLASILNRTGHDQEAMRIYEAVLPIARSRPQAFDAATYANLHSAMGSQLARQGRESEAIALLREGVDAASAHFGPQSRPTAVTVVSLAGLLAARGRAEDRAEARRLLEPLAEIPRIELGHGHHPLELLAELDLAEGRAAEADAKLERLIARLTAEGGGTMGTVVRAKRSLARIKVQLGQVVEARALLEEVLAGRRAFYGAEDPRTREIEAELAGLPSG